MAASTWTSEDIPNLEGKTVIITGASSGLGKEATKILAQKNARVIMAVRNTVKAEQVIEQLKSATSTDNIEIRQLDLGSLASIKTFAQGVNSSYDQLDILINNAGVMACPFSKTEDGFEIQMGTNHFGHFALTGLLMPLLKKTTSSRIVATSSIAHKQGDINFADVNWKQRKYNTNKAYSDSKLANLYFSLELARRSENDATAPLITAAHPGWTSTDLQRHSLMFKILNPLFSQNVEMGVLPTLRAATDTSSISGDYYGPKGMMELKGYPVLVPSNKMPHNEENAQKLWSLSEEYTGVKY
ncbi:MAG: oxidoreductase [Saprospiraceae bacterium]